MITCSLGDDGVPSYEDTCSFTCNTGYELTGSDFRFCLSNGAWNENESFVAEVILQKHIAIRNMCINILMYHT